VRKIFERLEAKGAIERLRRTDRAWIYRSTVAPQAMIRKEILRLLEGLFGGRGAPLVAHLADMEALSLDDIREIESRLAAQAGDRRPAHHPPKTAARRRSS
jgi:BlaI family penicillinase repressor